MKQKEILVFGATGQIGRNLIRKLTKNNHKVIAVTRNIHQKGYILKTQANPGYLDIEELPSLKIDKIKSLIKNCSICINLIGILHENKKNNFDKIHSDFPSLLAHFSNQQKLEQFIHVSSLGVDNATDSKYAKSKLNGEIEVRKNFNRSIILKPSLIYSVDDNFTTNFMTLLNRLPVIPLYYEGKTKFTPIHVTDMVEIIFQIIQKEKTGETIECIGPEVLSFKDIILKLLGSINKKRLLFPMPLTFAKMSTKIFQLMPNPILTFDQLNLLKYDNVVSGKYRTNFDLKIFAEKKFEKEIEKYSFSWRNGGQFSSSNYLNNK